MTVDFAAIKAKASRRTATIPLCLSGELVEERERLEQQLADIKPATSLGDASPKQTILDQLEAIRQLMVDSTVEFRLRALAPRPWSLFYATQPTMKENEPEDQYRERLFPWQCDMVSRSCYDPVMTADEVAELSDLLPNYRSWQMLVNAAYLLNVGGFDLPNSDAASESTGISDPT